MFVIPVIMFNKTFGHCWDPTEDDDEEDEDEGFEFERSTPADF